MIWIAIAILTGMGAMCVLWPISRVGEDTALAERHTDFYNAQMAELEWDRDQGLLSASEFSSATAEAGRRLIAATAQSSREKGKASKSDSRFNRRMAAAAAIIVLPVLSIGLYTAIGKPSLADRPLQARLSAPPGKIELVAAVAKIEKHLAKQPHDARGWKVIAPVYFRLKRYQDAVKAWSHVVKLAKPEAGNYASLGEAMFFAARGKVTPAAAETFAQALKLNPSHSQALFFLGLAAEQSGELQKAREIGEKLIASSPPGAPWVQAIRERLSANSRNGASRPSPENSKGPASQAGMAIAALPPAERLNAIRSMVSGLAARLQKDGKDLEGWQKLIRSYAVLNERKKAIAAFTQARELFASEPAALAKLAEAARASGLKVLK